MRIRINSTVHLYLDDMYVLVQMNIKEVSVLELEYDVKTMNDPPRRYEKNIIELNII